MKQEKCCTCGNEANCLSVCTLVDIIHKWFFNLTQRVCSGVTKIVGVDNAHHVLELVHPGLRRKRRFVPKRTPKIVKQRIADQASMF